MASNADEVPEMFLGHREQVPPPDEIKRRTDALVAGAPSRVARFSMHVEEDKAGYMIEAREAAAGPWVRYTDINPTLRLQLEADAGAVPGCTTECAKLREEVKRLRALIETDRDSMRSALHGPSEGYGRTMQQHVLTITALRDELASLRADAEAVRAENRTLRELLWSGHGHTGLYGDDGEMQCATCMIDYKRDSASEIERKRTANGQRALMARRQEEGQTMGNDTNYTPEHDDELQH